MRKLKRNYSPDQDRNDDGEFSDEGGGGGSGGSGGGNKVGSAIKKEVTKAVPGAKSVSIKPVGEQWHATVDGTKYKADVGEDTSLTFTRVGKGPGPKSFDITVPDSAFNVKHNCSCGCGGGHGCSESLRTLRANLGSDAIKYERKGNTAYMIVPVVMARDGVVMNGSYTDINEFMPAGWNGRPVTLDHPSDNGTFMSANDAPTTDQDWQIGTLYNARIDDNAIKADAWIDIAKANSLDPTLISRIKKGDNIDVSTGYFCDEEATTGVSNGREYQTIARNIVPDHLAFLPNEEGACNWADGCGVRANKRRLRMKSKRDKTLGAILKVFGKSAKDAEAKKVLEALDTLVPNARGADDDARQIVADLISNDKSPFTPDDQDSLNAMSADTLKHMAESYLKPDDPDETANADDTADPDADGDQDPEANEGDADPSDDEEDTSQKKEPAAMSKKAIQAIVNAAVKAAVGSVLTADDRLAINTAKKLTANKKAELIEKIVKNSTMKKAEVEKLELATLELIANGLQPATSYAGRAVPVFNADDDEAKDMLPPSAGDIVRANRQKGAH